MVALSVVLPVYNKADILPRVVDALARHSLAAETEVVFVDDASTDGSVDALRALTHRLPHSVILANQSNAGPAVRLNQGAAVARGRRLFLIDADILPAADAAERLMALMDATGAPMIHGRTMPGLDAPPALGRTPPHTVSDTPLATVLRGGFVRMGWLVETALFHAAGGCDPRLFIQDESLPLRLARRAERLAQVSAVIGHAPKGEFHLSSDRRQQHHDRFLAHYNLLRDAPDLAPDLRRQVRTRCLSAAWKAARTGHLTVGRLPLLLAYGLAKAGLAPGNAVLDRLAEGFRVMPGVRRPDGCS